MFTDSICIKHTQNREKFKIFDKIVESRKSVQLSYSTRVKEPSSATWRFFKKNKWGRWNLSRKFKFWNLMKLLVHLVLKSSLEGAVLRLKPILLVILWKPNRFYVNLWDFFWFFFWSALFVSNTSRTTFRVHFAHLRILRAVFALKHKIKDGGTIPRLLYIIRLGSL